MIVRYVKILHTMKKLTRILPHQVRNLKNIKKRKMKQTDEHKMTHMQSRVCEGSPGYIPLVYGSMDLWKKYVLSLERQVKELCLCVMLPVTVKIMVRDSFTVDIIVCSKGGGPVYRYSETW